MAWKHDINGAYNSFYGAAPVPSSLEVVSNDNPSSVKVFKALSIESSTPGWTGSVYTNKDREATALQTGDFSGFIEKEGNQYSAMPRSTINSTSNITFLGISDNIQPTNLSDDLSWDLPLNNIPGVAINPSTESLVFFNAQLKSITGNGLAVSGLDGYSSDALKIIRYNEKENSVTLKFTTLTTPSEELVQFNMTLLTALLNPPYSIYIMTNPAQDGDTMRGPYAGIKLTLPDSSTAFELFAINVDYEKTKLDGSLG